MGISFHTRFKGKHLGFACSKFTIVTELFRKRQISEGRICGRIWKVLTLGVVNTYLKLSVTATRER